MAVTQAIPITRHPYADGSYKKMLIDGQWIDAASGKSSCGAIDTATHTD